MRFCFLAALVASLVGPTLVHAQTEGAAAPSNELDEAARLLFENGTEAFEAGRFDEARRRYQNAYELSGRSELLYNIATCHDRLDEREEALEYFERFLAENPDTPRAPAVQRRVEVLRQSMAPDVEQYPDPDSNIDSDATDGTDGTEEPDQEVVEPPSGRSLAGPIASFGVAGAGLITFIVSGLIANGRYDDAELECMTAAGCNEDSLSQITRGALIADIGLGVAIAGAAVGVVWLLVGGSSSDAETARRSLRPTVRPTATVSTTHAGVSLEGAF